ncbi:MAG TPA: SPOR domain-containing protein [Spirochaetia bacterium]
MERQRIFWVVLAVSVFVVIVLVAGVLLLRQHPATAASAPSVSTLSGNGTQVYEYQKEPVPGSTTTGTTTGKPSDQQTLHFYIGEGGGPAGQQSPAQAAPSQPPATPETAPSTIAPDTAPPPQTVAPAPKQTVAAAPKAPAAKAPQTRPAQRTNQYWIQTGSYKSQTKAEDLVAMLAGKGLTGRLFSTTANNDTFYRVRIGPYASKAEAEKFLGIVKQLQGLEASFISMVPAKKNPVN